MIKKNEKKPSKSVYLCIKKESIVFIFKFRKLTRFLIRANKCACRIFFYKRVYTSTELQNSFTTSAAESSELHLALTQPFHTRLCTSHLGFRPWKHPRLSLSYSLFLKPPAFSIHRSKGSRKKKIISSPQEGNENPYLAMRPFALLRTRPRLIMSPVMMAPRSLSPL